jgi:hypothetical protein
MQRDEIDIGAFYDFDKEAEEAAAERGCRVVRQERQNEQDNFDISKFVTTPESIEAALTRCRDLLVADQFAQGVIEQVQQGKLPEEQSDTPDTEETIQ